MKYALIIGNNKYDDAKLAQLKTPAADSQALAKVLDDKTIGSFDEVTPLINQTETLARRIISAFLANKKPDDLVLLYFSGHGVLDERGRLYLALRDTQLDLLKATSIPASFVADEMDSCRSKRQILILDCCHSGAFARGTKGEQKAITETTFEGSGFGRVVLTASDSTQYALEGDQVIKQTELSLFTHFLLEGLKTGEADVNNDGHISLDEWYDYTYANVISETPRQVPHKWSYNQQGDLIIARNPFVKKRVVELPYELLQAIESPFVGIRESGVTELGKYLRSRDPEMVDLAVASLKKMKEDDSRRISSLAERLLSEFEQSRAPAIKMTVPKPIAEMESEIGSVTDTSSMASPRTITENKPIAEKRRSRPEVENIDRPADFPLISQGFLLTPIFLLKWVGATVLMAAILNMVGNYLFYNDLFKSIPIFFGISAGLVSLMQWFVFPNELRSWWIAANVAAGILLGSAVNFLNNTYGWWGWGKDILFAFLVIGNLVLGSILMWKAQEKSTSVSATRTSQGDAENLDRPVDRLSASQGFVFDNSFWAKWIGPAILGVVISIIVYFYAYANLTYFVSVQFGIVAGIASFAQRLAFRDRLETWWIAANMAVGTFLGALHYHLYNTTGWGLEDLGPLLALWVIVNFVLGLILVKKPPEKPMASTEPVTELVEADPRQNIFVMLLSIFLILYAFLAFIDASSDSGFLGMPSWLLYATAMVTAIESIFVGITFNLNKDIPRNFGFISFAIFTILNGLVVALNTIIGEFPVNFFNVPGMMALLASLFFVSRGETWKHLRYIMLSCFLIFVGLVYLGIDEVNGTYIFSIITAIFALLAGIFFFLRK
ncbi:MAG TPA: caspase family protein [Anaerolineales bacterium]|nr:caspase family protein [Anaerolineales bacterium]